MSSQLVTSVESLTTSNVVFSELKKTKNGSNMSFVNYKKDGKSQRLIIQIPKMFAPFGASTFKKDELPVGQIPKYDVQLSLDTKDKKVKKLSVFLKALDKMACLHAAKNKDWLKQLAYKNKKNRPSSEVAEDLEDNKYTNIVRESSNEKYPDMFKVKIPIDWNTSLPAVQVFSQDKTKMEITFDNIEQVIPKLTELKGLIQISHVWFVSGKFGIVVKILQALTYQKDTLNGLTLMDDSDDEEEEQDEEEDDEESEVEVESDEE